MKQMTITNKKYTHDKPTTELVVTSQWGGYQTLRHFTLNVSLLCEKQSCKKAAVALMVASDSALKSQINFIWLFKCVKFMHCCVAVVNRHFLLSVYAEHSVRKCISSSTEFELHIWHSLWLTGCFKYMPASMLRLWGLIRKRAKVVLRVLFGSKSRYFSAEIPI